MQLIRNNDKIFLLKVIILALSLGFTICIQIQQDTIHEKQFNQLFSHRSARHILGFVQKGVVDYENVNDIVQRTYQQIDEQQQEFENLINYTNKMILRLQNDQEKYITQITQKKQLYELELSQLNQNLYQNYKQPKTYQQQLLQNSTNNQAWLENKIKQTLKTIEDQQKSYDKDMEQVQTSFSSILDIFSLIDEIKHLQKLNQASLGQKKSLLSSKAEELCKSKISNSLIFIKSDLNVLLSQNFEDSKTIEKVRSNLSSLIEEIINKRDSSQRSYDQTLAELNKELKYLYEKQKENNSIIKKANIILNSLEKQTSKIEQQIEQAEKFLLDAENQIAQKNLQTANLIQMHQNKIKEIQIDQEKIKNIEIALYDKAFSTFLVKKLQNQNFKILEDNIW